MAIIKISSKYWNGFWENVGAVSCKYLQTVWGAGVQDATQALLWIKTAKLRVAAPFNLPMSRRMFTAFTNHAFVNILQMSFFAPFRNDLTKMAQLKYPKPYSTVEFRFRFGEAGWWGAASYQTKKGFDIHIWQSISNCCLKQQNLHRGTIRCDISCACISRPLESSVISSAKFKCVDLMQKIMLIFSNCKHALIGGEMNSAGIGKVLK